MSGKFFEITKLQAAERQIETAAKLFFNDGDSISIHTLSEAGCQILKDIAPDKGMAAIENEALKKAQPELKKRFLDNVYGPRNFFKHAERDPNEVLTFDPQRNELSLIVGVLMHTELSDSQPPFMRAFYKYFITQNPDLLSNPNKELLEAIKELKDLSKKEFIKSVFESEMRMSV